MSKAKRAALVQTNQTPYKKIDDRRRRLKKKAILDGFFQVTGNISHLCHQVGIQRCTFYSWLKSDPEFAAKIQEEEEGLLDYAENCLFMMMKEKIPAAVIFYLKTKGKHRGYVERFDHAVLGQVQMTKELTITIVHTREDDTEFLKEFEAEINREVPTE